MTFAAKLDADIGAVREGDVDGERKEVGEEEEEDE